jgi:hypothetical protein
MFSKLTDTSKATIFTVLVLLTALGAALLFKTLGLTLESPAAGLCIFTPALAGPVMLLVVTRDGFSGEGWKTLVLTVWASVSGGSLSE